MTGASSLVDAVDPLIGTTGADPTEYGGMVPAAAPPFAMTRWTPMTRLNGISTCAYHHDDDRLLGFLGSHQPAIWMGDWGFVAVAAGVGEPLADGGRGLPLDRATERAHPASYAVDLLVPGGRIRTRLTGTSRVGVLEILFDGDDGAPLPDAHLVVRATRDGVVGDVAIDPARREITTRNPERQDAHLGPPQAASFSGYAVARVDVDGADTTEFAGWGTAVGDVRHEGETARTDADVAAWVRLPAGTRRVVVRTGVSLISAEQARANLDDEVPDGTTVDEVVTGLRDAWAERLDRVRVTGATDDERTTLATALFHALQYPARLDEPAGSALGTTRLYCGYQDAVVTADHDVYTAFSLWDTFRAQHALLILLAPDEVPGMVASLLRSYRASGWLPVWENLVETNIMVGTHADSVLAESWVKGVPMDLALAHEATLKNATVPPDRDTEHRWADRGPERAVTARAGLTRYLEHGWVAADETAEAGSRTLDYAYDDHAVAVLAEAAGEHDRATELRRRAQGWRHLWNAGTGFLQARDADGAWAEDGWTEGTRWPYLFQVLHDIPGLLATLGPDLFRDRLEEHVRDWNRHDNEPSHHIPYLFSLARAPHRTAEVTRQIARRDYLATPDGLCGNDDLGQMSAWYVFTALGFYPVNPVSAEYVIGAPLFDRLEIDLPGADRPLVVTASGAPDLPYVTGVSVDGVPLDSPVLPHGLIADGGVVAFAMSATPTAWGTAER